MENFTNSIIVPENLPAIDKKTFNLLDKNYLKISYIQIALFFLFSVGGLVAFILLNDDIPGFVIAIISSLLAVIFIYLLTITIFGFPRKGYLVRENDISFKKGIITYKQTTIPFNRIQHVEVNQGVLAKLFKLSSLKIFTAGGNASDLSIPGLPQDVAQNLKAFLSEKISEHE